MQDAIKDNLFAFKLSTAGSFLDFGYTDSGLYSGAIEKHAVDMSSGFWEITGASVSANGTRAAQIQPFSTIIDSGTTLTYGPPADVAQVYALIPNTSLFDATNGYYQFPCDQIPSVTFSWGGRDWAIDAPKWV